MLPGGEAVGDCVSTARVPLQWVEWRCLCGDDDRNEDVVAGLLLNGSVHRVDREPACAFERVVARV